MKRFLAAIASLIISQPIFANHITGGQIYYSYGGLDGGNHRYNITLLLYRDSLSTGAPLDPAAPMGIFDNGTGAMVWNQAIVLTRRQILHLWNPDPCISNPPTVVYEVGHYEFTVSLPPSPNGYTIVYQRCCRINGINNLNFSSNVGATYTAEIPGIVRLPDGPVNNSARFIGSDTVITCSGFPFSYSFAAVDPDPGDQLRYSFCSAYLGGGTGAGSGPNSAQPDPPAAPPYGMVPYAPPFSGVAPLGAGVTINATTGLISGIVPPQGIYVVTVCVEEVRSGVVIATQRKDLQIKAGDCVPAKATLNPQYITCDGFTLDFFNLSNSALIHSYYWEFGDPASGANNTSNIPAPTHTFTAAGDYTIKLVTNRHDECSDSTTAVVSVWPGFFPDFNHVGVCLQNPVAFQDATTTNFGVVDSWSWNFGDLSTLSDTSSAQHPSWNYADTGSKQVTFIVTNSKGCIDTLVKTVPVIAKPPITLAFKDTLICVPDAVQLFASGPGNFSWTPAVNISNANSANPTVSPTSTTVYHVVLNEQGCINNDSVRVRVVNFVTVNPMPDTVICETDTIQLRVASDGLRFQWSPSSAFIDPAVQNPIMIAGVSGPYSVIARIGSCSTQRTVNVTAIPYPLAHAGADTIICYNKQAFLHGTHNGDSLAWSPASSLSDPTITNPVATPPRTTEYVLTAWANRGCPKPGRDSVIVAVMPKIIPFAGNDTMVIVNQPLQLNAGGGVRYEWRPSSGLNNPFIQNPVGIYPPEIDSIRYTVLVFDSIGCVDSASVKVTVFKTNPYVFVPTAFTPNNDGLNDRLLPIAVGVKQINYFAIYNRWGQLVFKTSRNGHGWDGAIGGRPQGTNVYVWMVSAVDYLDNPIFLKGTSTLIR